MGARQTIFLYKNTLFYYHTFDVYTVFPWIVFPLIHNFHKLMQLFVISIVLLIHGSNKNVHTLNKSFINSVFNLMCFILCFTINVYSGNQ